jgi:hypothetical protein
MKLGKKGLFGRKDENKKKSGCCCCVELEEIPEGETAKGKQEPKEEKPPERKSCCK